MSDLPVSSGEAPTAPDELLARITEGAAALHRLCNGERFTMSVPARPDSDIDLLIGAGLRAGVEAVAALRAHVRVYEVLGSASPASPEPADCASDNPALWAQVMEHAKRLSGSAVAQAVVDATDAVWDAGLDHEYAEVVRREGVTLENAATFHGHWLRAFIEELEASPASTRPDSMVQRLTAALRDVTDSERFRLLAADLEGWRDMNKAVAHELRAKADLMDAALEVVDGAASTGPDAPAKRHPVFSTARQIALRFGDGEGFVPPWAIRDLCEAIRAFDRDRPGVSAGTPQPDDDRKGATHE